MQVWHNYTGSNVDPAEWIEENADICYLVLPRPETERLCGLDAQSKLTGHSDAIKTVSRSSTLGRLLFSSAVKMVAMEEVRKIIREAMEGLETEGAVTESRLVQWMSTVSAKLDGVECIEELQGRRECSLTYRGLQLMVVTKSPQRLAELTMRLAVRSVGASCGALHLLPGEEALAGEAKDWNFKVNSVVLGHANRARKQLRAVLRETTDASKGLSGDDVKASAWALKSPLGSDKWKLHVGILGFRLSLLWRCSSWCTFPFWRHTCAPADFKKKGGRKSVRSQTLAGSCPQQILRTHGKQFHHLDAFWELDDLILKSLLGDDGVHKMKQKWEESVIPKSMENADVTKSLETSRQVVDSQATLFATAAVKAEISAAHAMLERLDSGESMLPCRDVTPWCGAMAKKLEIFLCATVKGKVGKKEGGSASSSGPVQPVELKSGVEALQHLYDGFKTEKPASLTALKPFAAWRHLLTDAQAKQVAAWRDDVLKSAGAMAETATKPKPAKICKKKAQSEQDLTAAALAMLKMPTPA